MKFGIRTQGQSFSAEHASGVVATELDGGRPRLRRDVLNGSTRVNVAWSMTAAEYDYAMAFFRTTTLDGSLPFDIQLSIDSSAMAWYEANFVPKSFVLNSRVGQVFNTSAQLDVAAATRNAVSDAALVTAYNAAHGIV